MERVSIIQVGKKIDDFEFEINQKEEIKKVKLSIYQGKLLFYPSGFTFIARRNWKKQRIITASSISDYEMARNFLGKTVV